MWRCLLISLTAVLAQGAKPAGPSEFYIVSESFSDNGAAFYYRVLEVKQDGSDSLVRYIRVAPLAAFCRHELVQAVETRIRGTSPAELVKNDNPCAVKPKALNAAVKKYSRRAGVFETISFGIVAQCESESITLGLPIYEAI